VTELLHLTLNGASRAVAIREDESLLEVLRREFQQFGVREACGIGICGSCTVALDGRQASACLLLAAQAQGRIVETVDVMTHDDGTGPARLGTIQQAFVDHTAFQCSFCTPGFLLATRELLAEQPDPTPEQVRHFLAGNLCRCGSYLKIEDAVLDAAARLRTRNADSRATDTDGSTFPR
jgi:carbon-monoxide dehydrogenase small subunit